MSLDIVTVTSDQAIDTPERNELGESPIWVPYGGRKGSLLYVAVTAGKIHRHNMTSGRHDTINVVTQAYNNVSFVVPEAGNSNRVVAGVYNGEVHRYEFGTKIDETIAIQRYVMPGQASNDGKVARDGELWFGTKNKDDFGPDIGTLGRLQTGQHYVQQYIPKIHISQGPAWSPKGDVMYYNDSGAFVWAVGYDRHTGKPDLKTHRVFATMPKDNSVPDGLTVDKAGRVYVAKWGTDAADMGRIDVYEPQGDSSKHVARIELPTSLQLSSLIFGGENNENIYFTTANFGKSKVLKNHFRDAGKVFVIPAPFGPGVPETPFNGRNFPNLNAA